MVARKIVGACEKVKGHCALRFRGGSQLITSACDQPKRSKPRDALRRIRENTGHKTMAKNHCQTKSLLPKLTLQNIKFEVHQTFCCLLSQTNKTTAITLTTTTTKRCHQLGSNYVIKSVCGRWEGNVLQGVGGTVSTEKIETFVRRYVVVTIIVCLLFALLSLVMLCE